MGQTLESSQDGVKRVKESMSNSNFEIMCPRQGGNIIPQIPCGKGEIKLLADRMLALKDYLIPHMKKQMEAFFCLS